MRIAAVQKCRAQPVRVRVTGSRPTKGMPVLSAARQGQSQSFSERTHEGYDCVERSPTSRSAKQQSLHPRTQVAAY
eukprot:357003-Chlamydomonas_euryale.AAC.3